MVLGGEATLSSPSPNAPFSDAAILLPIRHGIEEASATALLAGALATALPLCLLLLGGGILLRVSPKAVKILCHGILGALELILGQLRGAGLRQALPRAEEVHRAHDVFVVQNPR